MFNLDNEGISFGEEEIKAPGADDISISTDDEKKKEEPAEEPKEEPKKEEAKEEKKIESNFDVETPSDEKKEEPSTDNEDEDDLDLSDLFADIEDAKDAGEDSAKILGEVAAAGGTISPDQIKDLEAQLATQKDINTRLSGQVKKLMNDSVDMSYKNAELEAFG